MPLTLALATTLGLGLVMASSARADGMLFQHTIPREVDAYDFTTGGPYMAPRSRTATTPRTTLASSINAWAVPPASSTG